jgi:hypothetical protein
MAWTQDDLDAIEKKIASGNQRIRMGDRDITQWDIDELIRRRNIIAGALSSPAANSIGVQYVSTSKGLS